MRSTWWSPCSWLMTTPVRVAGSRWPKSELRAPCPRSRTSAPSAVSTMYEDDGRHGRSDHAAEEPRTVSLRLTDVTAACSGSCPCSLDVPEGDRPAGEPGGHAGGGA